MTAQDVVLLANIGICRTKASKQAAQENWFDVRRSFAGTATQIISTTSGSRTGWPDAPEKGLLDDGQPARRAGV